MAPDLGAVRRALRTDIRAQLAGLLILALLVGCVLRERWPLLILVPALLVAAWRWRHRAQALVSTAVVLAALGLVGDPSAAAPAAAVQPSPAAQTAVTGQPAAPRAVSVDDVEVVTRVIDGDTFEVAGYRRIRVVGIDSCETGTDGGQEATAAAHQLLDGQSVRLTPGLNAPRDRYGRELQRVFVPATSIDYATAMVSGPHTGVYSGPDNPDPAFTEQLRLSDSNGRTCTAPTPEAAPVDPPADTTSTDSGGTEYVPLPDPGDGYCATCHRALRHVTPHLHLGGGHHHLHF